MDAVNDTPALVKMYSDLYSLYVDLLTDDLAPYSFELAYELSPRIAP